jgi:hypothetical protein
LNCCHSKNDFQVYLLNSIPFLELMMAHNLFRRRLGWCHIKIPKDKPLFKCPIVAIIGRNRSAMKLNSNLRIRAELFFASGAFGKNRLSFVTLLWRSKELSH